MKHFKESDFFCKDGCELSFKDIDPSIIDLLEKVREAFGEPLFLNSSVRCPHHNKEVGGARFSQHIAVPGKLKGHAVDIRPHDQFKLDKLKELCDLMNPDGGVGFYRGFVHIDTRGHKARWEG